jgi:Leucine-rich repeat (LRR) protein
MMTNQLPEGSIAFLDGNFAENRNVIKSKLKMLGVQVKTAFEPGITHIIIGKNPPEGWRLIAEHGLPFLTEADLYPLIKNIGAEAQFLIQEELAGESQMAESLKSLLTSPDTNTVQVAMQMLKTGGLPMQLAEELLMVAKTNDDTKVRAEAKKLLKTQGPPEWSALLDDKQVFANILTLKQKETRAKLEKTAQNAGVDDAAFLSVLLLKYFRRGAAYALSLKRHPRRLEALELLTSEDGLLDFHTGVGYHTWAPEEHTWASQKINTGIAFPSDHPNPLSIKKLNLHNCKISAISSEISVFANLEELDATHNVITGLHPSMAKLTKLRKLNLMGNKITEFPPVLFKMPWLREVDFRVPPSYYNGRPALVVPPEFTAACPECVVLV